jgi:general secretion pathway protein G
MLFYYSILLVSLVALCTGCLKDDPERQAAQEKLILVQEALTAFYYDTGRYPTESEQLGVLIEDQTITGWRGPYLSGDELIDPWQHAYTFGGFRDVIFVASAGRNGKMETTQLDLNQGLSRGDDVIIMFPNEEQ